MLNVILCYGLGFAQTGGSSPYFLPKISPQAPNSAAFAKFGNYPMNMFTGVPEISIPIYTIQLGELQVPISISYHASGNKVTDNASWVGLGWALNAGGAITRKVMGLADETPTSGYLVSNYLQTTSQIDIHHLAGLDYLRLIKNGIHDVESDIYSYSFPGKNGKFIFNQLNGNTPIIMPFDPMKINTNVADPMTFDITDEGGKLFKFGASFDYTSTYSGGSATNAKTAFMLTQMVSANKRDISILLILPRRVPQQTMKLIL